MGEERLWTEEEAAQLRETVDRHLAGMGDASQIGVTTWTLLAGRHVTTCSRPRCTVAIYLEAPTAEGGLPTLGRYYVNAASVVDGKVIPYCSAYCRQEAFFGV